NAQWQETGEVGSLLTAKKQIAGEGPLIIGYGDVVVRNFVMDALTRSEALATVVLDYKKSRHEARKSVDWALATPDRVEGIKDVAYSLVKVDDAIEADRASGEWIGLIGLSEDGAKKVAGLLDELAGKGVEVAKWSLPQLLNAMV